jgi:hypothetical protein
MQNVYSMVLEQREVKSTLTYETTQDNQINSKVAKIRLFDSSQY